MIQFRRYLTVFVAIAIIGVAMAMNMGLSSMKKPPKQAPEKDKTPIVEVIEVKNGDIRAPLEVSGKLTAARKINLFAEVSGVLLPTAQDFKAGSFYSKGELLLNLNDTETRANITAQKSELLSALVASLPDLKIDYPDNAGAWETYINYFDLSKSIQVFPETKTKKEKYFITSRKLYNLYFSIKSLEERLVKFKVQAPFDGVLTLAMIQTGTLVNPGQQLGEFIQKGNYELEVPLRPSDLSFVSKATKLKLHSSELDGEWTGKVARINEAIDPTTQTLKAYITVKDPALKQGMYMSGELPTKVFENSFEIDRSLLREDNRLAIIKNKTIELAPITVAMVGNNTAIVIGLEDGSLLLATPSGSLKAGTKVQVK